MKKIVVISDSFKGTLSSLEIAKIAERSIPEILPTCQVVGLPIADGGEGTVDCFVKALGAKQVTVSVTGPYLGTKVDAVYGQWEDCAVIEMAAAAGLPLVGQKKDPSHTTTFGVGELIAHAVENGAKNIYLGIGGSATNDGGCGCAAALGVKFYDYADEPFVPVGARLHCIDRIDVSMASEFLRDCRITVMCDVTNPLYGKQGAAYIFGPQKGADADEVEMLDQELRYFASVIGRNLGVSVSDLSGAGAAGGMGAGCVAFLGAEICPGIETMLTLIGFKDHLRDTDLVITGEGRIDSQSLQGKVISGIARCTADAEVPLIVIAGSIDETAAEVYDKGVSAVFSINRKAESLEISAPKSAENYENTLKDILRLIRVYVQR